MKFDPRILPTALIAIDILAACGYAYADGVNEWRRVVYWMAAATLTYTVTW